MDGLLLTLSALAVLWFFVGGFVAALLILLSFGRRRKPEGRPQLNLAPPGLHLRVTDLQACPLKVFYSLLFKRYTGSAPKPQYSAETRALMRRGVEIHVGFQRRWRLKDAERFVRWDDPPILGRIDGRLGDVVYEIKSVRGLEGITEPKPSHVVQVNTYLGMLSLREAVLVYVDQETGERREFRHEFSETLFEMTLRRARGIWESFLEEVPPDPEPNPKECGECPFRAYCPAQTGGWNRALENAEGFEFLKRALSRRL